MLRITETANALHYFRSALAHEDYYAQGSEFPGIWYGKLAEQLELDGKVVKDDFHAICHNLHPSSGDKLKPRNRKDAIPGWDFTVSVPKSVSLLYGLTDDPEILEAFHQATYAMLDEIESDIRTRVRTQGRNQDRTTENMLTALFVHTTSRPVNGTEDPHLHGHAWIPNMTYDENEDRYKAAKMRYVWENAPYYEALFDKHMMTGLRELGYDIEQTETGWEIAGISREIIDKFSRRTQQIEAVAAEKNVISNKIRATLGARTRDRKRESIDANTLQASWWKRLSEDEQSTLSHIINTPANNASHDSFISAEQAVEYACNICLKRKSLISDKHIAAAALKYAKGFLPPEAIHQALASHVQKHGMQIIYGSMGQVFLTTPSRQQAKQSIINLTRNGLNSCKPLYPNGKNYQSPLLSESEQKSLRKVLSSYNRIIPMDQKHSLNPIFIQEAFQAIEQSGKTIYSFSPTPSQTSEMVSVQQLLQTPALQTQLKDQVAWIDLADKLGMKELNQLFQLTEKQDARVILSNSSYQQYSKRGDGLYLMAPFEPKKTPPTPHSGNSIPPPSNPSEEHALMVQRLARLSMVYASNFPMTLPKNSATIGS